MSERADSTNGPLARNLAASVFRFARSRPSAMALLVDGGEHTYADLAAAAARVAAWLHARAAPAPRVGILAAQSPETYAGILGAAWVGGTYVPLHPKQPPTRLASILERARLDAIVTDRHGAALLDQPEVHAVAPASMLRPNAGAVRARHRSTDFWPELPEPAPDARPADVSPEHPAYIMFTSGTTGVPKGVVVTVDNVLHFRSHMRDLYGIGPSDRMGQFCETSFDVSVFEMFAAWDAGASLHVVPESKKMAPAGFIRRQQLTVWTSVPSVISMLAALGMLRPGMFPTLRISFFIGEALDTGLASAWQDAAPNSVVDNQYGPTETTVAFTVQRLTDPPRETPGRGTLAIGRPYPGLAVEVIDDQGGFLPAGQTGELALHGPQVAAGYLDDPEQTRQRFPVLFHPQLGSSRWYRTGDLGFRDDDGVLHCLGRLDNQIKVMGHRVELEDVEAHLRAVSGALEVAAIAGPTRDGTVTAIVGFVCGATPAPPEIRERLRERLPAHMLPRRIERIEHLPRTANGKVDRRALRARIEEGA